MLAAAVRIAAADLPAAILLAQSRPGNGGGGGGAASEPTCVLCHFVGGIEQACREIVVHAYEALGPTVQSILATALVTYFVILGLRLVLGLAGARDLQAAVATTLFAVLALIVAGNFGLFEKWIVDPIQQTAIDWAIYLIRISGDTDVPTRFDGGYQPLVYVVERQIKGIYDTIVAIGDGISFYQILKGLLFVVLTLIFLFVILIFTAFMIESLFKFTAITLASPLFLAGAPFAPTRPFAIAALRVMLGAGFTIVFAGGAMAVTVGTVNLMAQQLGVMAAGEGEVVCVQALQSKGLTLGRTREQLEALCKQDLLNLGSSFITYYALGFVSIFLHLGAKALASNLSGANDGVGPAAATVAAFKGGLALTGAGASRILMGGGGLRGMGRNLLTGYGFSGGGQSFGEALAHGGVMGGSAYAARSLAAAVRGTGGSSAPGSGAPLDAAFSPGPGGGRGGGSGGGGFSPGVEKQLMSTMQNIERHLRTPRTGGR